VNAEVDAAWRIGNEFGLVDSHIVIFVFAWLLVVLTGMRRLILRKKSRGQIAP
jgi:hypothetical protein